MVAGVVEPGGDVGGEAAADDDVDGGGVVDGYEEGLGAGEEGLGAGAGWEDGRVEIEGAAAGEDVEGRTGPERRMTVWPALMSTTEAKWPVRAACRSAARASDWGCSVRRSHSSGPSQMAVRSSVTVVVLGVSGSWTPSS